MVPGAGRPRDESALANGIGPKILAKKANTTVKDILLLISKFRNIAKVYTIFSAFATRRTLPAV
jgi:hypothetical protein